MATAVGMTTAGSNRLRTTVAPRVLMQWQWQQPSVGSVTSNCTAPQRQAPFTVSATCSAFMLYRRGKLREAVGDREPRHLRAHVDVVERPGSRIIIQRAGVDDDEVGPAIIAAAEARPTGAAEDARAGPIGLPVGAKRVLAAQPAEAARRHKPV